LQVSLGVTSAAKASDDAGVHIGQGVDNAPGEKLFGSRARSFNSDCL